MREGNGDEGDEIFLENKYKRNIKYEYLEQSPGGINIEGGRICGWFCRRKHMLGMKTSTQGRGGWWKEFLTRHIRIIYRGK